MVSTGVTLLAASAAFFVVMVGVGAFTARWIGHNDDYLVAGGEINWWVTGLGIGAVIWAGDFFALLAIFAVTAGVFAAAVPYLAAGVGYILYGTFFSSFVRTVGSYTVGEFLEIRFDARTRLLVTLYLAVAMLMFLPAGTLGVANILHGYVGWPVVESATGMIAVIGLIVLGGGLWGVTVTDVLEAAVGYLALPAVLLWFGTQFGGVGWLVDSVPGAATRFSFPGGFGFGLGSDSYVTWTVLWGVMLIYGSPYYWIRAVAARSDRAAKRGYQIAGALAVFLAACLSLIPLYGFALAPETFTVLGGAVPPAGAVGVAARFLPTALGVVFMMTIVAANVSTYTTTTMGGIAAFSRDFYQRLVDRDADPYEMLAPTRMLTVVFLGLGWALLFFGNVQFYLEVLVTYVGISTVLTVAGAYSKRVTATAAFAAAVVGGVVATAWILARPVAGVHQIYPTLAGMLVTLGVVTPVTSPRYDPESAGSGDVDSGRELSATERRVVRFVAAGATRFGDLLDVVPLEGTQLNEVVERLERDGLVEREGLSGPARFRFALTAAGERRLDDQDDSLVTVDGEPLPEECVEVLSLLADRDGGASTAAVADALSEGTVEAAPYLTVLRNRGYVRTSGALRTRYVLTEAGRAVLAPESQVATA